MKHVTTQCDILPQSTVLYARKKNLNLNLKLPKM